jgi:hypothetical protein
MFNLLAIEAAYNKLTILHWLIVKVESLFPGKGAGASKLDLVLNTVQAGVAEGVNTAEAVNEFRTANTAQIATIVAGFNASGGIPDASTLPPLSNFIAPKIQSGANNLQAILDGKL